MKTIVLLSFLFFSAFVRADSPPPIPDKCYLFTSFRGNGEGGPVFVAPSLGSTNIRSCFMTADGTPALLAYVLVLVALALGIRKRYFLVGVAL